MRYHNCIRVSFDYYFGFAICIVICSFLLFCCSIQALLRECVCLSEYAAIMLQASVLSSADRLEIPNYKYHGGDLSLMYKYALSPFAQFCVDKVFCNSLVQNDLIKQFLQYTPLSIAPNVLTFIGLLASIFSLVVTLVVNPSLGSDAPRWFSLFSLSQQC